MKRVRSERYSYVIIVPVSDQGVSGVMYCTVKEWDALGVTFAEVTDPSGDLAKLEQVFWTDSLQIKAPFRSLEPDSDEFRILQIEHHCVTLLWWTSR